MCLPIPARNHGMSRTNFAGVQCVLLQWGEPHDSAVTDRSSTGFLPLPLLVLASSRCPQTRPFPLLSPESFIRSTLLYTMEASNGRCEWSDKLTRSSTFVVRALYGYQPTDPSQLSFRQGDMIDVIFQPGWWNARMDGKSGFVSSKHVTSVDPLVDWLDFQIPPCSNTNTGESMRSIRAYSLPFPKIFSANAIRSSKGLSPMDRDVKNLDTCWWDE
jgi:hypothetical protein